jgi:hypothetical protein
MERISSLSPPERNGGDEEALIAVLTKARATESPTWVIPPLRFPRKLPGTVANLLERAYVIAEEGALPQSRRVDLTLAPFGDSVAIVEAPTFDGDRKKFNAFLRSRTKTGERVVLLTSRPAAWEEETRASKNLTVVPAEAAETVHGFLDRTASLHIITDADLGDVQGNPLLTWDTGMAYARRFSVEDFVVHRDHGIARFRGIEQKAFEETARDYLILEYAQRDRLYVPVELASKVTAYIGAANPLVHRLGGADWENTTRAVRAEASDLARELLALFAARETESGTAYPPDTKADVALAETFPGFTTSGFLAVAVPKATPLAVQERLNALINEALVSPPIKDRLANEFALRSQPLTLAQCAEQDRSERAKWGEYVKIAKIEPQ